MSFWKKLFESPKLQSPSNDPAANLKRWKVSGQPEAWVAKHPDWNHNDWLELLALLRKSQYWPMDEAAIGEHLEIVRMLWPELGEKTDRIVFF